MIISNRLMNAAFHALISQLAADARAAADSGNDATIYGQYISEIQGIRAQLACYANYGEDLTVSNAVVLLPGEQA